MRFKGIQWAVRTLDFREAEEKKINYSFQNKSFHSKGKYYEHAKQNNQQNFEVAGGIKKHYFRYSSEWCGSEDIQKINFFPPSLSQTN